MDSELLAVTSARAADDKKAMEITILEVGDLLVVTDYFMICSGRTDRQVRTIVQAVRDKLSLEGHRPIWVSGESEGLWVAMDYGSIVVHVFRAEEREYYRLERLWRDAPTVEWEETERLA